MLVMCMIVIGVTSSIVWSYCFAKKLFLFDIPFAFSRSASAVCLVDMQNVPGGPAGFPLAVFSSSNVEISELSG